MSPRRSRDICYTSEQRDAYVMPRNLLALPGPPAWLDFLELDDFLRAIEASEIKASTSTLTYVPRS